MPFGFPFPSSRWLAALALAWAAAFSNAQSPPASESSSESARTPAERDAVDIALVLPLDAAAYARAAEAVREGFLAAAEAARPKVRVKVFAHGDDGVLTAFEAAHGAGAPVVVGPLVRDDLKVVASMALELPYTIALNQFEDGASAPPRLYTFALSIDADARLIARRMRETAPPTPSETVPNVAILSTETPLMKRFAGAFATEWLAKGGSVPTVLKFDGAVDAMTAMRRDLQRRPPAALLLAMDGPSATLAKPYIGSVPAYASALVFEREAMATARDLDGLTVTEIPWIVTPDAPQFASLPHREMASAALTRLYALGLDAFRVAASFRDGPPDRFSLDGATGQIVLDGRTFTRESRFAVFRDGNLVPVDAGPK
ncbi:MAG: penicillin-binding protein activator [Burkholderiales bacterium]